MLLIRQSRAVRCCGSMYKECTITKEEQYDQSVNRKNPEDKGSNLRRLRPMLSYVPEHIVKRAFDVYGETLEGAAEAIWQYNKEIIDNTYDLIPAVKPQIAMYEQFGIEGLVVYKKTVDYCHEKGLVVIGDAKRGDIGSTSAAYATGHLAKYRWVLNLTAVLIPIS